MKRSFASSLAILAISFYRNTLSLMMLPSCRFSPSCSRYAQDAIGVYGVSAGSWKALRRVLRCHPLSDGGVDPVRGVE